MLGSLVLAMGWWLVVRGKTDESGQPLVSNKEAIDRGWVEEKDIPTPKAGSKEGEDKGETAISEEVDDEGLVSMENQTWKFRIKYDPERKIYEAAEGSGRRFTFYRQPGNIALHVGDNWSWTHPGREFDSKVLVAGQETFVYEISSQTITDWMVGERKYSFQCIHQGNTTVREECQKMLGSVELL